jgi:hypothetical protein
MQTASSVWISAQEQTPSDPERIATTICFNIKQPERIA